MTLLYALIENRQGHLSFGKPFYIGIGTEKRPYSHMRKARSAEGHYNLLMHAHLVGHLAEGVEPVIQILAKFDRREDACQSERDAIKQYGRMGRDPDGILCNVAHGGQGPDPELLKDPSILAAIAAASRTTWQDPAFRQKHRESMQKAYADPMLLERVRHETIRALREPETRAKHLTALRRINAAFSPEQRRDAADKVSKEARKKSADALRGILNDPAIQAKRRENSKAPQKASWADPEIRAKRIAAMKGKKKTMSPEALAARRANAAKSNTPEANAKKGAASFERWQDQAFKEQRSISQAAAWEDPEKRANMLAGRSTGISSSWSNPEVRARRIAGIKAAAAKKREESER